MNLLVELFTGREAKKASKRYADSLYNYHKFHIDLFFDLLERGCFDKKGEIEKTK